MALTRPPRTRASRPGYGIAPTAAQVRRVTSQYPVQGGAAGWRVARGYRRRTRVTESPTRRPTAVRHAALLVIVAVTSPPSRHARPEKSRNASSNPMRLQLALHSTPDARARTVEGAPNRRR